MSSTQDQIERRIRILEEKQRSDSPVVPGIVRSAKDDAEAEIILKEFKSLPKNVPCILIHEIDCSMPRPEKK